MNPYYQQQGPQAYYQVQQSRGFQPPQLKPRPPQQNPYPQTAPLPPSSYSQQYQSPLQHQQPRPAQFFSQRPAQPSAPQLRYAPQPTPVHQAPAPPAPSQPSRSYTLPQPHIQSYSYSPSPSNPQPRSGPVAPPLRANSQSPDKERRPLPDPGPTAGLERQRPTSMPPTTAVHGAQVTTHPSYPAHASSSSVSQISQSFAQTQSFQGQIPRHPPSTPQQPHRPISYTQATPNTVHTAQASSTHIVDSTASKRPLPARPGETTSHSTPPATPGASPASTPVTSRRTLPFSPTKPPNVEEGIMSKTSTFPSPKRSSTLPTLNSVSPNDIRNRNDLSGAPVMRKLNYTTTPPSLYPQPPVPTPKGPPQSTPAPFSRPHQKQRAQSLAFRLAALSLQEERTQTQRAERAPPSRDWAPFKPNLMSRPIRPSGRSGVNLDDSPPVSGIRGSSFDSSYMRTSDFPPRPSVPTLILPEDEEEEDEDEDEDTDVSPTSMTAGPSISITAAPVINISHAPAISFSEVPSINVSEPSHENAPQAPSILFSEATPTIMVSKQPPFSSAYSSSIPDIIVADLEGSLQTSVNVPAQKRRGLICYGCGKGIIGRIVSAMGGRWHPSCFKCTVCGELLEHVSSYEHEGNPYCHLDYHEKFAPYCYHCRTPIIDERFITLDDPALGKRTYHEQHFFCAECGDPFLAPTIPGRGRGANSEAGVVSQEDDVGFTVYRGHPYCEACHVRLRYPKCKRCKKSIRDGMQAVEALGGKWCWECFLCAGCERPFDDPAFFQRDQKPYCEPCFSLIIRNEI